MRKPEMEAKYEIVILSDLLKKSRCTIHPDFQSALHYIFQRLDELNATMAKSQFSEMMQWLRKIFPQSILIKVLYHLRYDAMIGFRRQGENREIYGMITFQKHRQKIGMFDIYISPKYRAKDLLGNFSIMAKLVYEICTRFAARYRYIQCGHNDTTRNVLKLYRRLGQKNHWHIEVDVAAAKIYLGRK